MWLAVQVALILGGEEMVFRLSQTGEYDSVILAAARDHRVSPWVLKGLLTHESGLRNVSSRHGTGIAQFVPSGVRGVAWITGAPFTMADALVPQRAIPAAAVLLAYGTKRFGSVGGIAAYRCPSHGHAVRRLGLAMARRRGLLRQCGAVRMGQGYPSGVMRRVNDLRRAAHLLPLRGDR